MHHLPVAHRVWSHPPGTTVAIIVWVALNLACVGRAEGLKEINPPKEPDSNETTALVGARLINGRGGPPIENSVVVVRGSKLIAVGRRGSTAIPRDAKQIDASGMSLLPGLM